MCGSFVFLNINQGMIIDKLLCTMQDNPYSPVDFMLPIMVTI